MATASHSNKQMFWGRWTKWQKKKRLKHLGEISVDHHYGHVSPGRGGFRMPQEVCRSQRPQTAEVFDWVSKEARAGKAALRRKTLEVGDFNKKRRWFLGV